jgi:hypothetical protein
MQVHTVRCQRLAMPLFHKKAKVRIPLWDTCSRGFHSLSLDLLPQRYCFDVTFLLFARGIAGGRREPAVRTVVTIA